MKEKGLIYEAISSLKVLLSSSQKKEGTWMFLLLLVNSFLDVFGLAALVPVIMVASEPGAVARNKYFGPIYHSLNFQSERVFLTWLIIIVFTFFLLKNLFSVWIANIQVKFTTVVSLSLIDRQMTKFLNFPFWHFNNMGSATVAHNVVGIPSNYISGVLRPLIAFLSEIVVVLIISISIVVYKPFLLLLLAVVLGPATYLTYRTLRSRSMAIGNRSNELRPVVGARQHDLFIGYAELKLANKLNQFRNRIMGSLQEIQALDAESYLYGQIPVKVIELVAVLGVVTIFFYTLYFSGSMAGLISLVGIFVAAAYRLMPSVNRMLMSLVVIKQYQFTIGLLQAYEEAEFDAAPHPQQQALTFNQSIEFSHVSFTFPTETKPALQDITLRIRKGEKIGFVGSSGSGKTTLMNILLRFYIEQEGAIRVDGQTLDSKNLLAWHQLVGYVKQDTFLMEASIQDNITLSDPDVDAERLNYAIEQASLQTFVKSLPDGVNTFIGERGSKLSGGQRQRIGIARALYKKTEILVLDEATSALDNETEREVSEAITKLSATDITILIIAHRITTLRECTRIYELSGGQLLAEHQYADLVQLAL